jgi:hypothetical protein
VCRLMRREIHCAAAVLVLICPALAAVAPGTISAALCGRGEGPRAIALDTFDPIPWIWQETEIEELQPWFDAQMCPGPSEEQARRFRSRRRVLEGLRRRLERAEAMERIGATLEQFRGRRPGGGWPSTFQCDDCTALWASVGSVAGIAGRWPPGSTSRTVGERLDQATQREPLVEELCAARPPHGAQEKIETRFRYYSWTADGAKLFEVAALFERSEVVALCEVR